jgi:hypothetical protein
MRKFGMVVLFAISQLTLSAQADEFSLAAYSVRSPQLQWLSLVTDQIVRRPMLTSKQVCGSQAACALVSANLRWRCDSVSGQAFYATDLAVRLFGTIYYYPGRMPADFKPFDRSVVDGLSAVAHEYQWHIIPAAREVVPLLAKLQRAHFASLDSCEAAGKDTSVAITTMFVKELSETQQNEVAGKRVDPGSSGHPMRAMLALDGAAGGS